jgi:hypothetical protein
MKPESSLQHHKSPILVAIMKLTIQFSLREMKGKYTHNCKMLVYIYMTESAPSMELRTLSKLISIVIYHRFATWIVITAKISENSWRQISN